MDFLIRVIIHIIREIVKASNKGPAIPAAKGPNPAELELQRKLEEYVRGRQKTPAAAPAPVPPARVSAPSARSTPPPPVPPVPAKKTVAPPKSKPAVVNQPAAIVTRPAAVGIQQSAVVSRQAAVGSQVLPPGAGSLPPVASSRVTPRRGVGMSHNSRIKLTPRTLSRVVILSEIWRPPLALRE